VSERRFPVLFGSREQHLMAELPRSVPWSVLAGHEDQAQQNHSQTLERLAERGGLGWDEMWCIVHGKRWHERADEETCRAWLRGVA
jgi:hypothetical protein